jgi:hypothetical protein
MIIYPRIELGSSEEQFTLLTADGQLSDQMSQLYCESYTLGIDFLIMFTLYSEIPYENRALLELTRVIYKFFTN